MCKTSQKNIAEGKDTLRVRQIRGLEKGSIFNKGKWEFLLDSPFPISEECCNELKKKPLKKFTKESGKKPMMGTMAAEGGVRKAAYLETGCNAFSNGKSQPMGFWTEQDVFEYILENNLRIASVYGDIIKDAKGNYTTSKEKRTGCIFCMFGVHLEKSPNRFERMKESHPQLYKYCMNTLKLDDVLNYINVKH